jgi:alpha 1,3-glucosidase
MPFVGADVGGFFGNPNAELVWRWYQMGSMQPFFRAHAHLDSKRREPWIFGDPWTSRIRNAVKIRYKLLPFWSTLFYEAHVKGVPCMRPIWYSYPTATDTFGIETQFMLGDTLLVIPVTEPGQSRVQVRN